MGLEVVDVVVCWEFADVLDDGVGPEFVGVGKAVELLLVLHWTLAGQSQNFSSSFQRVPEGQVSS